MRFYVGVRDNAWFDFLRQFGPDEVNFWRPSGKELSALEVDYPIPFLLCHRIGRFDSAGA